MAENDIEKIDSGLSQQVREELEDLRKVATSFGPARLQDGTWFNEFLQSMLSSYSKRIVEAGGVEYFRQKYPGLTQDAIADKLCTLAPRYAAVAGGVTGLAASSVVFGGLMVPVLIASIGAEVLFVTRLQVRLVYDLAMVYGDPIDVEDPEHLYRAFVLAYAPAAIAGPSGAAAAAIGSEVAKSQMRRFITGRTPLIQAAAINALGPRIGATITRRAIVKSIAPVVGVAISSGWNYASTSSIAGAARKEFRLEAHAREQAIDICRASLLTTTDLPAVVQALQAVMNIDGKVEPREITVYQAVAKHFQVPRETLNEIERRVEIDEASLVSWLLPLDRERVGKAVGDLLKLTAASSGIVSASESAILGRLLGPLGQTLDTKELERLTLLYRRETSEGISSRLTTMGNRIIRMFGRSPALRSAPSDATPPAELAKESSPDALLKELQAAGFINPDDVAKAKMELQSQAVDIGLASVPPSPPSDGTGMKTRGLLRLHALINLMKVDGGISSEEREFLNELLSIAQLSPGEESDVRNRLAARSMSPLDVSPLKAHPSDALTLLFDLVMMAKQDQGVHPAERLYIKKLGKDLGLQEADIEDVLAA